MVTHVHNMAEYENHLANSKVVVAKYSAEWCGPCKMIAPIVEDLARKHKSLKFIHIDGDRSKDILQREGVRAFPTFHFFVNGEKRQDLMIRGADQAKLTRTIESLEQQFGTFSGQGYSLRATDSNSSNQSTGNASGIQQKRSNPWADPDFANKMMGTSNKQVAKPAAQPTTNTSSSQAKPPAEPVQSVQNNTAAETNTEASAPPAPSGLQFAAQVATLKELLGGSGAYTDEYLDQLLGISGGDVGTAFGMLQ